MANTLNLFRIGAVGFIDWLGLNAANIIPACSRRKLFVDNPVTVALRRVDRQIVERIRDDAEQALKLLDSFRRKAVALVEMPTMWSH